MFTAGEMGLSVAVALDRSFSMAGERLTAMSRASEQFLLGAAARRPRHARRRSAAASRCWRRSPPIAPRACGRWRRSTRLAAPACTTRSSARSTKSSPRRAGARSCCCPTASTATAARAKPTCSTRAARRRAGLSDRDRGSSGRRCSRSWRASTGGRSFHVTDLKRLPDTLKSIASELRAQYLLGYTPSRPLSGKSRMARAARHRPSSRRHRSRAARLLDALTLTTTDRYQPNCSRSNCHARPTSNVPIKPLAERAIGLRAGDEVAHDGADRFAALAARRSADA